MSDFAVIIDLNGTLADTEMAFFQAYRDVLARYSIQFTLPDFTLHWSTKGKKLKDYLEFISRHDLLEKEKEMLTAKDAIFQRTLTERAVMIPGAKEIVSWLKKEGIPLGLDSSSSRDNIDQMLNLFGMTGFFSAITSGTMALDEAHYGSKKKKSSRMKSLADTMGYQYTKCIVVGDAEKDILGAKEAGMLSVAIPNTYTKTNDFSLADIVVKSFSDITPDVLASIVEKHANVG